MVWPWMRDGELSFLAGEYVLGVLPAEDAREVERKKVGFRKARRRKQFSKR